MNGPATSGRGIKPTGGNQAGSTKKNKINTFHFVFQTLQRKNRHHTGETWGMFS